MSLFNFKPDRSIRTEVFTLDEGEVMMSFPAHMSSASLEDLKQYLDIFYRRIMRIADDPVDAVDMNAFKKHEQFKLTAAE